MSATLKHNKFLYKNFLTKSSLYGQVESYWERRIDKILKEQKLSPRKWIENNYADGRKIRNGNPIYSAIISSDKTIRLIQEEPESETIEIGAWIDNAQDIEGNKYKELVVSLELTKQTKVMALAIIERWVEDDADEINMQEFISKTLS